MRRLLLAIFVAIASLGAAPAFDTRPWLEDLDQTQAVFIAKYADLEWAVFDREADLPGLFAETRARIERAHSEYEARVAFDRLARRLNDEHVGFAWPQAGATQTAPPNACAHYNPAYVAEPLAAKMDGYRAIASAAEFPSGLIDVSGTRVGVLKIGLFEPEGWPSLCEAALAALKLAKDKPCDDSCSDKIDNWVSARMTLDLAEQLRALNEAGAKALLIDIASNGGGTEWAEAVARMVTPIRIVSDRIRFARGAHWAKKLADAETDLRNAARTASPADRKFLLGLADEAEAKRRVALTPCDGTPVWQGKHPACTLLGDGFYMSGLLASADPAMLRGKSWAADVFTPMEFPYEEGVWRGPLIVLIDRDTASASSEFAAVLQDNRAAIIMGEPSGGGCGHTDGGTPTTLANSKAVLAVPDCARIRADGTNEARGIEPDVLVGFALGEGTRLRAARILAKLPEALAKAGAR